MEHVINILYSTCYQRKNATANQKLFAVTVILLPALIAVVILIVY